MKWQKAMWYGFVTQIVFWILLNFSQFEGLFWISKPGFQLYSFGNEQFSIGAILLINWVLSASVWYCLLSFLYTAFPKLAVKNTPKKIDPFRGYYEV